MSKVQKVDADVFNEPKPPPEFHGARAGRAVTDICPSCYYAYADGGYCPPADGGCGWMLPVSVLPYGMAGRKKR